MTKDDALKLALEALEKVSTRSVIMGSTGDYREGQLDALSLVSQDVAPALTAIKELLTQPSQEHVAWMYDDDNKLIPLYTAPPRRPWVGLTDEEAAECWTTSATLTWKNFENALRSKNT